MQYFEIFLNKNKTNNKITVLYVLKQTVLNYRHPWKKEWFTFVTAEKIAARHIYLGEEHIFAYHWAQTVAVLKTYVCSTKTLDNVCDLSNTNKSLKRQNARLTSVWKFTHWIYIFEELISQTPQVIISWVGQQINHIRKVIL